MVLTQEYYDTLNTNYSNLSPFNIDIKPLLIDTTNVVENQKFMCIYNKLTSSPKFKDLFVDTFGESKNLNVTFEIANNLPNNASGNCQVMSGSVDPVTGQLINLEVVIKII